MKCKVKNSIDIEDTWPGYKAYIRTPKCINVIISGENQTLTHKTIYLSWFQFVGGPFGQGFSFSDKQVMGVTSIKVTMDPISVFGVESPCVLVQGVDIRACCEGW